MVSRRSEHFEYQRFSIGQELSRSEIAQIATVEPLQSTREWTGIVSFENCIVLFVTLEKADLAAEHGYSDYFDDELFFWESQNRNTQNTPHILRLLEGEPVSLFCRLHPKIKSETQPFVYCGRLVAEDYQDEQPVCVRFVSIDYSPSTSDSLDRIYAWRPQDSRPLLKIESDTSRPPANQSGQGRVVDAKKRKAIELAAMKKAIAYYESVGYTVSDTSSYKPYDLECGSPDGQPFRVEVKGLSQDLGSIILTIGEVNNALDPSCRTDLFVVYNLTITFNRAGDYVVEGGEVKRLENWNLDKSKLSPTRFNYQLSADDI